jgi:hypothetical protein
MLKTFLKHCENTAFYVALQNKLAQNESDIWSLVCGGAIMSASPGERNELFAGLRVQAGLCSCFSERCPHND